MQTYFKTYLKICRQCGKSYKRNKNLSSYQWSENKYCSRQCAGIAKQIHDQYKDKQERYARKHGALKQGTPEWLERIRNTTKNAMYKPDVQSKIRSKRKPLSEDHKALISKSLAGKMPANMLFNNNGGLYKNIQNGDYENSKGTMYFRSKWEANYALYLDYLVEQGQIKDWEFEPGFFIFDKISHGTTRYMPDFLIKNVDGSVEYHEIKGYMDSRSKTKLRRMAKYYPNIKLVLIDSGCYRDIQKKLGAILHFY